ncbi:hypothetical protein M9Y10_024552 [Tritrichomonas musculus]|uniref:Surface antigen BspA-like n=1 Tax=Tritrichomonas musculus TaxID=1915356 RepID=A0ABR2HCB0_9EUKA
MLQFFLLAISTISYEPYTCRRDSSTKCPEQTNKKLTIDSSLYPSDFCNCKYTNDVEITFDAGVTSIKGNLFYGVAAGTVKITSSINTIEKGAFESANLRTIDFTDTTSSITINEGAFYRATFNKNIELEFPDTVTSLPREAFYGATAGKISFGKSFNSLGELAFQSKTITEIDFSKTTQTLDLGKSAFQSAKLTKLTLPRSVTYTDFNSPFSSSTIKTLDITNLKSFPNNIDNKNNMFTGAKITEIVADEELEEIGSYLFQNCNIDELDFSKYPELETIGISAFKGATITRMLNIQKIRTIGESAFEESTVNIVLSGATELETIGKYAFKSSEITPTDQVFPGKLKSIGEQAFFGTALTSVKFSDNNNELSIGDSAFKDIITLASADIHAKTISQEAFSGCVNMVANKLSIEKSGSIVDKAFYNCYNLNCPLSIETPTSTLKSDLSSISTSAFENSGITTITLPQMNTIGGAAFKNCTKLTGAGTLNAETILANAFENDPLLVLTSITAKSIGDEAFQHCPKLDADITLIVESHDPDDYPYGYEPIGSNAFAYCDLLKTLKFQTKEGLDVPAFDRDEINNHAFQIGNSAFYESGLTGKLTIPFTLTTIGGSAFAYCPKLTEVTIEGVHYIHKYINYNAFYHSGLANDLSIPNSVVSIGYQAFAFCPIPSLTIFGSNHEVPDILNPDGSIAVKGWTGTQIGQKAFYECNKMTKLALEGNEIIFDTTSFRECPIEDLSITASLSEIPIGAFYGMDKISKEVKIPDSVTDIKKSAFEGCSKIPKITFTDNSRLDTIGTRAFYGCSEMTDTQIPKGVTVLAGETYFGCAKLESINLPSGLTTIGDNEFYGCTDLNCKLPIPIELSSVGSKAFYGCNKLNGPLEFTDSTTEIGTSAFYKCSGFTGDLIFGRQIKTIGKEAFRETGFTGKLFFPDYLYNSVPNNELTINERAFYGCDRFKSTLSLPQNTKFNGKEIFRGCSGFTSDLIIPEGSTFVSAATDTFRDCSSFGTLNIKSDKVTNIYDGTFQGCTNLKGTIPFENIKTIGKNAFSGCSSLSGPLHLSATEIQEYAFCNCQGFTELICEKPLEKVNKYAFYGCSGLTGTLDCTSLKEVHEYAFYGCSGLTGSINFTENLEFINEYAFANCKGLSDSLTFKVNTLTIDLGAFQGCTGFNKGTLRFIMKSSSNKEEDNTGRYYSYPYFLKIDTEAFEDTKFEDIYYLGRFAPDCGYDSGLKGVKKIYTSANFANKTFCGKTVKGKGGLSGGAIAGIVIAVVVVVAVIVFLVIFFLKKKGKDNSEGEVEMNNEP